MWRPVLSGSLQGHPQAQACSTSCSPSCTSSNMGGLARPGLGGACSLTRGRRAGRRSFAAAQAQTARPACMGSLLALQRPLALTLHRQTGRSVATSASAADSALIAQATDAVAVTSTRLRQDAARQLRRERAEIAGGPTAQEQQLLRSLGTLDAAAAARAPGVLDVGHERFVTDPDELNAVGDGLPVIDGADWPQQYWQALKEMAAGGEVEVPRPHPKFTMQDMERISASGPSLEDLVLEHVERLAEPGEIPGAEQGLAHAFRYVPRSVLGDYTQEVEPVWASLPEISIERFWAGLRARNWTSAFHTPNAIPWRVQLFSCGYLSDGVTGWAGWRAVITTPDGVRAWVSMPDEGELVNLRDTAAPSEAAQLGWRHVFAQLYQAYEPRFDAGAVAQLYSAAGAAGAAALPAHETPALRLLDVSYHQAASPIRDDVSRFLIAPSWAPVQRAVSWALESSGLHELRQLRDSLLPEWKPPTINLGGQTGNMGAAYFAILLTAGIVIPAMRRSRILDIKTLEEDPGAAMEFARSKSEARKEGLTGVQFKDVAGLDPILNEVIEVVDFLKDPKSFSKLGAKPPKGILLEGDPGTGKTLLARALAGEAMVPFYQMSGTEFTEGIVGVGAARVRDLFKRARAMAPCVIFVDEIDALGLKRAENDSAKTNEEREQTLNQLLTEMDGFTPDTGVVFLGATNRADLLDPALMRPGRFDRKVRMPKPDTEGRYEILQLHLRNKQVSPEVDLMQLARDLPGLVGADLANIVNEAAMTAARQGRSLLTARDIFAGVDRFTQGEIRPPLPSSNKLPVICFAAKEVGISLVATVLQQRHGRVELVERVSIQPKGRSFSRTMFQRGTDEDYHVMTRGKLMDRIRIALAGSAAVKLVLGEDTNFQQADIKRATAMAKKLVLYYGMSDLGITTWASQPYSSDFLIGQQRSRKVVSTDAMDAMADWPTMSEDFRFDAPTPSDVTWHRYTDEVRKVIKSCMGDVMTILEERKEGLWAGIKVLSDQKELLGDEMRDVFDAHPPRKLDTKPGLHDMTIFTAGENSKWPYGIEWLNDAYPVPYWVRQQQEKDAAAEGKQAVAVSTK